MRKIKAKEVIKGTIKQLDRAAIASDRMKQTYIQTKDKADNSIYAQEVNPEEYASDCIENGTKNIIHEAGHQAQSIGRDSVHRTKENIAKSKEAAQEFQKARIEQKEVHLKIRTHRENLSQPEGKTDAGSTAQNTRSREYTGGNHGVNHQERATVKERINVRSIEQGRRRVKQSASSAGEKTIKKAGKSATQTSQKGVKTAEKTAKTTIKISKETAEAARKSAQASAKAAKVAKVAVKEMAVGVKAAVKTTVAAIKVIISAAKALISAIIAGGWIAVLVIVVILMIALLTGSVFGIFFSGEDSGTGLCMPAVVQEINADFDIKLEEEKAAVRYDSLEMSGSRAAWKDILAIYAVKTNTDPNNPQEVATMDGAKKQLLSNIFWEMNSISSHTETTETITTLYIVVSCRTVDEMAQQYGFTKEQKDHLGELLRDENNQLWSVVLYGIGYSDNQIVTVALSQIGNYGGSPYWGWYGYSSHVEWCACFVSWCANECGYIDSDKIPKFAGCVIGTQWFKDRGQWMDGSDEPAPGMLIFFDWDEPGGSSGPQDDKAEHVGIVEKVENGTVYTVEGNSGDSVRINSYPIGYYEILGYGVPKY